MGRPDPEVRRTSFDRHDPPLSPLGSCRSNRCFDSLVSNQFAGLASTLMESSVNYFKTLACSSSVVVPSLS